MVFGTWFYQGVQFSAFPHCLVVKGGRQPRSALGDPSKPAVGIGWGSDSDAFSYTDDQAGPNPRAWAVHPTTLVSLFGLTSALWPWASHGVLLTQFQGFLKGHCPLLLQVLGSVGHALKCYLARLPPHQTIGVESLIHCCSSASSGVFHSTDAFLHRGLWSHLPHHVSRFELPLSQQDGNQKWVVIATSFFFVDVLSSSSLLVPILPLDSSWVLGIQFPLLFLMLYSSVWILNLRKTDPLLFTTSPSFQKIKTDSVIIFSFAAISLNSSI